MIGRPYRLRCAWSDRKSVLRISNWLTRRLRMSASRIMWMIASRTLPRLVLSRFGAYVDDGLASSPPSCGRFFGNRLALCRCQILFSRRRARMTASHSAGRLFDGFGGIANRQARNRNRASDYIGGSSFTSGAGRHRDISLAGFPRIRWEHNRKIRVRESKRKAASLF